ncbi:LPS-assembly lipoprotein [Gammaproteobacteria bacterium]
MSKSYINIYSILITIFFLSGCGFTLRMAQSLPPQLHQAYYQTDNPYGQFEIAFKRALKASNVILLAAPNATAPVLHVTSSYTHTTTSSISSAVGRVYNLNYTAIISIDDASGKLLLSSQTASAARDITLQHDELFEVSPQVEIVQQELLQELATKVLNILCAKKTFQALAESNHNENSTTAIS